MICGVGMDLLEISRMEPKLQNEAFLRRMFTERELAYIRSRGRMAAASAAAAFCAKEALGKALGIGLALPLTEMEVTHGEGGEPRIALLGASAARYPGVIFHLSLTHTETTAGAVVVAEVPR